MCLKMKAVIEGSLGPFETTHIQKPFYCPKLGRELTNEEENELRKVVISNKNKIDKNKKNNKDTRF